MTTLRKSAYWDHLWKYYGNVPSIALCRVPELEFASRLPLSGKVLDHCCGDGEIAGLAWPGRVLDAGCDLDSRALELARKKGIHARLDCCDASVRLPYEDATFDVVYNNSALEHIPDIDGALAEVARVTAPGGLFAFSLLNHRFYAWWPMSEASREAYRKWQPVYHAYDLSTWSEKLRKVGFEVGDVQGYFNEKAARELAYLDCEFSGVLMRKARSRLVEWYWRFPRLMKGYWRRRLSRLQWKTEPDEGAGYFIQARRCG
jgi:SAM-dependent methyltransferase